MSRRVPNDWFPRDLPAGLQVGTRSLVATSYAFLHCPQSATIRIGSVTGIYQGTFFDLGSSAHVEIGDNCTLVGAILRVQSALRIGNYTLVAHEVVITDSETIDSPTCQSIRPITIGDDVWVGMRAIILSGANIGHGAVIGAGAVVTGDVEPMTVVTGNPARIVRRIKR